MNEETTQLWLMLLREWLDETGCENIVEYQMGFTFTYYDAEIWTHLDANELYVSARPCDDIDLVDVPGDWIKLSEFDICNPNTIPSERFRVLESHLDESLKLLDMYDGYRYV